jgi:hypothetical protein
MCGCDCLNGANGVKINTADSKIPRIEKVVVIRRIVASVLFHKSRLRQTAANNKNGKVQSNNILPNLHAESLCPAKIVLKADWHSGLGG